MKIFKKIIISILDKLLFCKHIYEPINGRGYFENNIFYITDTLKCKKCNNIIYGKRQISLKNKE